MEIPAWTRSLAALLDAPRPPDGEPAGVRERLLAELPLLLGLVVGWYLLWRLGAAFVPMEIPVGPDWHQYFMAAWKLSAGVVADYPAFRLPPYPWLVGTIGEGAGYGPAALFLASGSMAVIVGCAGLAGRTLAGPWAGGVAALSIPLVATNAEAARWASQYPFFGAVIGLALCAALSLARWPRWWWALAAGIGAGLSWSVDNRGTVALMAGVALAALALTRARGWRTRALLAVLFAAGTGAGPLLQRALQLIPRPSSSWLLQFQRGQSMGDIQNLRVEGLVELCTMGFVDEAGLLDAWQHPCGQALLRDNLTDLGPELPAGLLVTGLLLPLALLPGRDGWRGSAAVVLLLSPVLAALLFSASLIDLPRRYYVPFAVPIALIAPVALARLGRTLPAPWGHRLGALGCAALGLWLLLWGPQSRPAIRPLHAYMQIEAVQARLAPAIRGRLEPEDLLLDCSFNLKLQIALLPDNHHPDPHALGEAPDMRQCAAWLAEPPTGPGARWLVTDEAWPFASPDTAGWEAVSQAHDHHGTLWRREDQGSSAR